MILRRIIKKTSRWYQSKPLPPEKVDQFIDCLLSRCPDCGSESLTQDGRSGCLQQVELPEVKVSVTQFNLFRYTCMCCGNHSTANLPTGIPNSALELV
ncbi:IS66 family transposase zinc-finger binding domain-containing protein [Parachlamydia acanthamoebae]|uniref:IS66 family transposase zinc-finger binding domain-containing protein n=1 Tax=Parachlamydia acanthamoebae TaxID=83552 RepID=UPI0038CD916E